MALARNIMKGGWSAGNAKAVNGAVATGLVATGTVRTDALALQADTAVMGTVASGTGVILSQFLSPGEEQSVFNAGANALKVYPPTGFQINALATNAPMLLATNTGCLFKCISTTRVFGILSA